MTTPTPPAVSEAMREAVAREIAPRAWEAADEMKDWPDSLYRQAHMRHREPSLELADRILSGPIASEIARLTEERDAARAEVEAVKEWAGEPEGWPSLKVKWDALIAAAEEDHARAEAAEAETARLRAALKLAENPLSYRHANDPSGLGSIAVARALEAVRAALTSQEQADV